MFYTEMRELLECRLYIIIICICIYFASMRSSFYGITSNRTDLSGLIGVSMRVLICLCLPSSLEDHKAKGHGDGIRRCVSWALIVAA